MDYRRLLNFIYITLTICIFSFTLTMSAVPLRARYVDMKCRDPTTGRDLYIGDSYTRSGQCVLVQCYGDLKLWEDRCLQPVVKGNCIPIPPANEFLDYPKCCPLYECKTYQTTENGQMEETRTYNQYGRQLKSSLTQVLVVHDTRNYASGEVDKTDTQLLV